MSTRFSRFGWMFLALAFLAPTAVAGGSGCGGSHPHFDDRGTLTWYPTLAAASEALLGSRAGASATEPGAMLLAASASVDAAPA